MQEAGIQAQIEKCKNRIAVMVDKRSLLNQKIEGEQYDLAGWMEELKLCHAANLMKES